MAINVLHADAFEDNYIWILCPDRAAATASRPAVIVDPGDADPVFALLDAEGLIPVAILCTHHHPDHIGGIPDLRKRFDIPVYGPASESISTLTHPLKEGDTVRIEELGLTLKVMEVPGHTRGHIAYLGDGMLFCGDTLFSAGCGRLFEGTAEQMYDSLNRLTALDERTSVYCTHEYTEANLRFAMAVEPGNADLRTYVDAVTNLRRDGKCTLPSSIGLEHRVNPFLRTAVPAVKHAAERHEGTALEDGAPVFASLRRWKDGFRG